MRTTTRFDESDSRYLVVLPNEGEHNHLEEIGAWFAKWTERMDRCDKRFGVILVNHEHDHDEDEQHERNAEEENALTALVTKFRREERWRTNRLTTGYASIYNVEMEEAKWEKAQQRTAQFAAYMFGIRGRLFKAIDSAKAWLNKVGEQPPLPLPESPPPEEIIDSDVALFYGSTTGITEMVAEDIQEVWEAATGQRLPVINIAEVSDVYQLIKFEKLIIGIPTWNIGELQDDWEVLYPLLDELDLSGKQIAMFGVGDQEGYPDNFQDALGILGNKLRERGAELIGFTSTEGYEFDESRGVENDMFMGLAIDDLNQGELSEARIRQWVAQIRETFDQMAVVGA